MIAIFIGVDKGLTTHYEQKAKTVLVRMALEDAVKDDLVSPKELRGMEQRAHLLLGIKRGKEGGDEFLRRLGEKVGISLPRTLKIKEEQPRKPS